MSDVLFEFCTSDDLDCGDLPANVILCVDPSVVATDGLKDDTYGFINAQVTDKACKQKNCSKSCNTKKYWRYTFVYQSDAVQDGVVLTSTHVNGVFCDGCLLHYIQASAKATCPVLSPDDGNILQCKANGLFAELLICDDPNNLITALSQSCLFVPNPYPTGGVQGDFTDNSWVNWTVHKFSDSADGDDNTDDSISIQGADGNPPPCAFYIHSGSVTAYASKAFFVYSTDNTWDPSTQGAINNLKYFLDFFRVTYFGGGGTSQNIYMAVKQGGKYFYSLAYSEDIFNAPAGGPWQNFVSPILFESSFGWFQNPAVKPDFSVAGGVIEFGFLILDVSTPGAGRTVGDRFDNFILQVNPS